MGKLHEHVMAPFKSNNILAKVWRKTDPVAAKVGGKVLPLVDDKLGIDKIMHTAKDAPPRSTVMPDEDDEGIAAAKRRRLAQKQGSSGRASTIISAGETRLGG